MSIGTKMRKKRKKIRKFQESQFCKEFIRKTQLETSARRNKDQLTGST